MRSLAVVSGASRREVRRTRDRFAGFLRSLATLGAVDLVLIHDEAVSLERRREWGTTNRVATAIEQFDDPGTSRLLEVAAPPPRRSGMLREVHLHHSDAPERDARQAAWFRVVDSFVASAPAAHDLVWCADLAALTRVGWIRRALPAVVDIDGFEDLGSERARRAARRVACVAHLVTIGSMARREQLGLPGSVVAAPDDPTFADAVTDLVALAAAYRPGADAMKARSAIAPLARRGIRSVAEAYDRVSTPPTGTVVLAYHQVGGPRAGSVNLSRVRVADQMTMLAETRDRRPVLDLDGVVDAVGESAALPSVAVTFDDGTADFVDQALPILVDLGLPVALYLATGHVDEGRSFWDDGTVLSWAAVRDAHSTGLVTIGSHTHDHVLLDRAAADRVASDLDLSIERITEEVGVRPVHFAYPKALAPSRAARALVRDRFASAALAGGRPNRPGATDLWALDRTPVTVTDDLDDVVAKVGGGLRLEAGIRAAVDRVRYRGASR